MKPSKLFDATGCCPMAWRVAAQCNPGFIAELLNRELCNPSFYEQFLVRARPLGKESSKPKVSGVRCILPLPSMLQIVDALLAGIIHDACAAWWPQRDEIFHGGGRGTQVLDVSASCALVLEKGMDMRSCAALGQADIENFYDRINPILVARECMSLGIAPWVAVASTFLMLCTPIALMHRGSAWRLRPRASGALTGSRVAGAMGRVIVSDVSARAIQSPLVSGFDADGRKLIFCTWIDNIYSAGVSLHQAVQNLEVWESLLVRRWQLKFKASSRMCISNSKPAEKVIRAHKWVEPFIVLGIRMSRCGGCWSDLYEAEHAAWRRWFITQSNRLSSRLPFHVRMRDIERCVAPAFLWRCSWWQYNQGVLSQIKSTHLKFVSCILRLAPRAGEPVADYSRRRALEAQRQAAKFGCWSRQCAERALKWNDHALRNHAKSWVGILLNFRSLNWLEARRASLGSFSLAGRLDLRASQARPSTRFEEGVRFLKSEQQARVQAEVDAIPVRPMRWLSSADWQARSVVLAFLRLLPADTS